MYHNLIFVFFNEFSLLIIVVLDNVIALLFELFPHVVSLLLLQSFLFFNCPMKLFLMFPFLFPDFIFVLLLHQLFILDYKYKVLVLVWPVAFCTRSPFSPSICSVSISASQTAIFVLFFPAQAWTVGFLLNSDCLAVQRWFPYRFSYQKMQ